MAHQPVQNQAKGKIRQKFVQTTVRFGIVIGILLAFLYGFPQLPGTDQEIYEMTNYTVTVGTAGYSVITLFIFGAILSFATSIGSLLGERFEFSQVERVIQLVALLGIIVWANRVFYWLPYFESHPEQYDLLFLILGIGVAGWLGLVLYMNADEVSELFTRKVITDDSQPGPSDHSQGIDRSMQQRHGDQTDGGVNTVREPKEEPHPKQPPQTGPKNQPPQEPADRGKREEQIERDQSRTAQSGSDKSPPLEEQQETGTQKPDPDDETDPSALDTEPDTDQGLETECPECEEALPEDAKFCHSCGADLSEIGE